MKQTNAPTKTPSPQLSVAKTGDDGVSKPRSQSAIFMTAALDMSWRLAIVVLVPIVGGFELDRALHTSPVLVIIGFILAMLGIYAVLKQTVAAADERFKPKDSPR